MTDVVSRNVRLLARRAWRESTVKTLPFGHRRLALLEIEEKRATPMKRRLRLHLESTAELLDAVDGGRYRGGACGIELFGPAGERGLHGNHPAIENHASTVQPDQFDTGQLVTTAGRHQWIVRSLLARIDSREQCDEVVERFPERGAVAVTTDRLEVAA